MFSLITKFAKSSCFVCFANLFQLGLLLFTSVSLLQSELSTVSKFKKICFRFLFDFFLLQINDEKSYIFDSLPISFFTTFMLILGEMKYPHTVFKYQPLPYPWISYAIYMLFGICVPIIVKNLLVSSIS